MISFGTFHPITAAVYFASVLVVSMFSQNPILHLISFVGAMAYFLKINKAKFIKEFSVYLFMLMLVAIINPFFSHKGVTVLFFVNRNPITLEAFLYGLGIALMVISVIYWFKCFGIIMTEDKLLCLFGEFSPKFALLISSALRFVPLLKERYGRIKASQKAMGMYSSDAYTDKIKSTMRTYSSLIGWALENAIDTGTSMKSRGYGLKGRTHFSLFRFKARDFAMLVMIVLLDALVFYGMFSEKLAFSYYPAIKAQKADIVAIIAFIGFGLLCFMPLIIELKEDLQWKYYRSKI